MPTAVACRLCEMQQHHHRGGGGVLCPVSAAAAGTPLSVLPGHRHRDRSRDVSVYNQFRRRPPIDDVTRYHQHQQHLQQQQQHQHQQQAEYGGEAKGIIEQNNAIKKLDSIYAMPEIKKIANVPAKMLQDSSVWSKSHALDTIKMFTSQLFCVTYHRLLFDIETEI